MYILITTRTLLGKERKKKPTSWRWFSTRLTSGTIIGDGGGGGGGVRLCCRKAEGTGLDGGRRGWEGRMWEWGVRGRRSCSDGLFGR